MGTEMGASVFDLISVAEFHAQGLLPAGGLIVELGAQNISAGIADCPFLEKLIAYFRRRSGLPAVEIPAETLVRLPGGPVADFAELCGFRYLALDLFDGPQIRLFDLNWDDAPPDLVGTADLVTNLGITEHVLNQFKCFELMHRLTKPLGLIYHNLPISGYFDHGYFSYHPLFFQHLAAANEYAIVTEAYQQAQGPLTATPEVISRGFRAGHYFNAAGQFAVQKSADLDFACPVETETSNAVNVGFVAQRKQNSVLVNRSSSRPMSPIAVVPADRDSWPELNALRQAARDQADEPLHQALAIVRARGVNDIATIADLNLASRIATIARAADVRVTHAVAADPRIQGMILLDDAGRPALENPVIGLAECLARGCSNFLVAIDDEDQSRSAIAEIEARMTAEHKPSKIIHIANVRGPAWSIKFRETS
jgi:hypothetical protein